MRYLLVILFLLSPVALWATTTSGATPRNVDVTDGIVMTGAAPTANTTSWETDEEFQGFMGIVNWYLTWDDSNLYLGKIGGNNTQGSVVYLRVEYPGAQYTSTPQLYDGFQPRLDSMGGINFVCYFKDTYTEFRTWDGATWSAPVLTLSPSFSTQGNGDNAELGIPWNDISAGNGIPQNMRATMVQIEEFSGTCGGSLFVYAESPWGTGLPGDGPNIGTNDGTGPAAIQPGGCVAIDTPMTRWWGCYPIMAGVSSNGWIAVPPNAGPDRDVCDSLAVQLDANAPAAAATGTWNVSNAPGGVPTFSNPNDSNATVSGLSAFGTYTFVWEIDYRGCPSTDDSVRITRFAPPPPANAGVDQFMPCGTDSVFLSGNNPGPPMNGTGANGLWTVVSGGGDFANPNSPFTWVNNLAPGDNMFQWALWNGPCDTVIDQVVIRIFAEPFADVGPDLELCGTDTLTLSGNDPDSVQNIASATWAQASGPSTLTFSNFNQFDSQVWGFEEGTYVLYYTVENGNCQPAVDSLVISWWITPTANAGQDQSFCEETSTTLIANDPTLIGPSATGFWTLVSGPNVPAISNPNDILTIVTGLVPGTYVFRWTVANGACTPAFDDVSVFISDIESGGIQDLTHATGGQANGTVTFGTPTGGVQPYDYSLDGVNWQGTASFGSLAAGQYTGFVRDANNCTYTVDFQILDGVIVPTGFSPNGDLVNDTWQIPGIDGFPDARVEIYNIWGGKIYSTQGAYVPWNGQRNGKDMPVGNYYFVIELNHPSQPDPIKGNLTLFR